MKDITQIFYEEFIPEACLGRINCFMYQNIVFNLNLEGKEITRSKMKTEENNDDKVYYEGVLIPTLEINNKDVFDNLLIEYVTQANKFYDNDNFYFLKDLALFYYPDTPGSLERLIEKYKIKYIIGSLFANATYEDFRNPINFLRKRIDMFDNHIIEDGKYDFGYIPSINASVKVVEEKAPIQAETPYRLSTSILFDDETEELYLPDIYVGSSNDKYSLYCIMSKDNKKTLDKEHQKRLRSGFIAKVNGAPENYLLSALELLAITRDKELEVIPFLIERWNAKRINLVNRANKRRICNQEAEEGKFEEQERLQTNITELLMRYFTKTIDVTEGIDIDLYPFEYDDRLHITSTDENINCRCKAFNEMYDKYTKTRKRK